MADEPAGGLSGVDLPKAEGSIPRSGEGKLSVRGDDNVTDEVAVSLQGTAGESIGILTTGQGPDEDTLVARRREDHVGVLGGGSDGGDPIIMTREGSAK